MELSYPCPTCRIFLHRVTLCAYTGSANSPVAMALFHGEVHTLATTAGKIIVYTLATTLSSPHTSGNPRLARSGSGKAPLQGQDPQGEDAPGVDVVLSQLEQLVDLLEQYFHPSNNGGYGCAAWKARPAAINF